MADQWAYVIFRNGSVADSGNDTTEEFYEKASEFAKRHKLPFALIYLPDPNSRARYEQMKKDIGTDWLHSEPDARERQQAEVTKFPKLTIPCKITSRSASVTPAAVLWHFRAALIGQRDGQPVAVGRVVGQDNWDGTNHIRSKDYLCAAPHWSIGPNGD